MNDERKMAQKMVLEFIKMSVKHSKPNVPQPMPLIEKKAQERLSTDGIISFKLIIKEFEKVPMEERKIISELLVLASHDLIETMDCHNNLLEDHKDTADFVNEHPEYGRSETKIDQDSIINEFKNLFD